MGYLEYTVGDYRGGAKEKGWEVLSDYYPRARVENYLLFLRFIRRDGKAGIYIRALPLPRPSDHFSREYLWKKNELPTPEEALQYIRVEGCKK